MNDTPIDDPDVLVMMRTSLASQIRTLFDTLKELVPEAPITFETSSLKITSMDSTKCALCHIVCTTEFYFCADPPRTIGINVAALYKCLRSLTTTGYVLEMAMYKSKPDFLTVTVSNVDKRTVVTNEIRLLKLPSQEITIPAVTFSRVISMPASDFQRYVRELATISQEIRVVCGDDYLELEAKGSAGGTRIRIMPAASSLNFIYRDEKEPNVAASFSSRFLERFSKVLDASVEIYMRQSYPIVLRYALASATVRFCLASIEEDED